MFKKALLFLRAGWLCGIVTKGSEGLSHAVNVINYVQAQLDGSDVGARVNGILEEVKTFAFSIQTSLVSISKVVCDEPIKPRLQNTDVQESLKKLRGISAELKKS